MSRFGYIVSFVCCALVLGASVFTVCAELPDAMIEPKRGQSEKPVAILAIIV